MATSPRIYVACLACYNAGKLHGVWIDATDADTITEEVTAMQATCGHTDNDWAIHDYEDFAGLTISESEGFSDVAEKAEMIDKHGEAFGAFASYYGDGATEADFEEAYQGQYSSEQDFAEHLVDDLGYLDEMPEHLRGYFDYEKFARDLFCGDYYMTDGYVFRSL